MQHNLEFLTIFDEQVSEEGEPNLLYDKLRKHRVLFSFTNPTDTHMIELHNITASFRDTWTNVVIEEIENRDLGKRQLSSFSTYTLAYDFRIYGGLADEKNYTLKVDLEFTEISKEDLKAERFRQMINASSSDRKEEIKPRPLITTQIFSYDFQV